MIAHSHELVVGVTGLVANEMSVIAIAATELPIASAAEAAGCKRSLPTMLALSQDLRSAPMKKDGQNVHLFSLVGVTGLEPAAT